MKTWMAMTVAVALAMTTSLAYVRAQEKAAEAKPAEQPAVEQPKPEKKMIVGQAISISTYAMENKSGEDVAAAMKYEADKGFPVGILEEETGDVYVAVFRDNAPASHLESANKVMSDLMGKKVAAQGLIYTTGKAKLIRISLISEY